MFRLGNLKQYTCTRLLDYLLNFYSYLLIIKIVLPSWPPAMYIELRMRLTTQLRVHVYYSNIVAILNLSLDFRTLKGFATFGEFSFYGQKKVADYEYHGLFAEKIHFHT